MAAVAWLSAAGPRTAVSGASPAKPDAAVDIVLARCSMCHSEQPVWAGIPAAPGGVMFDEPARIHRQAWLIDLYAVRSNAMPPGNVTEMTNEERGTLAAWLAAGAPRR